MKIISIITLILLFSLDSFAVSNEAWLRKVSIQLTGAPADQSDMDKIRDLSPEAAQDFIESKISEYQKTHNYEEKMRHRLDELFRLRLNYHGAKDGFELQQGQDPMFQGEEGSGVEGRLSSLDQLFVKIFKKNLSWDQLLLEKEYEAYSLTPYDTSGFGDGISDLTYYSYIFDAQLKGAKEKFEKLRTENDNNGIYAFDPNDERLKSKVKALTQIEKDAVAGALTTARFFSRYPTTKLNKNRKRAAAVFRIFLCDSMQPVVLASEEENRKLLDLALNKKQLGVVAAIDDNKRHGEDPTCSSCHNKLDPAAKTFNGSSLILNKQLSAGALVYKRDDGSQVNVPVNGVGQLGKAITQQPEYLQCQVNHFWNWFIGQDVPLSPTKKQSLAQKFNELQRKPNDFIKYLLTLKDYRSPELLSESKVNYSHIKPLLKRCDSCHTGALLAPILASGYPFSIDAGMNEFAVGMIHHATSLDEKSEAYMPPKNAGWKLQGRDRDLLKAWIRNGAKDENGTVMLSQKAIELYKKQTILSEPIKPELEATFEDTHRRYYENYDLVLSINKIFGNAINIGCTQVYEDQSDKVGFLLTVNGKPLAKYASTSYVEYVQNCLYSTIVTDLESIENKTDSSKYLSETLTVKLQDQKSSLFARMKEIFGAGNNFKEKWQELLSQLKWSQLDNALKLEQIHLLYDRYIGNTVYPADKKQALINNAMNITDQMISKTGDDNLKQAIVWTSFALLTSEEFLTF